MRSMCFVKTSHTCMEGLKSPKLCSSDRLYFTSSFVQSLHYMYNFLHVFLELGCFCMEVASSILDSVGILDTLVSSITS
ncbi:hypothetical protein MPTK2_8g16860 [Marchantia polymorpha subsp. ruderalis]